MQLPQPNELISMRDWVRWGASCFSAAELSFGHGTQSALDDALALVLHALHLDHTLPADYLAARVTSAEAERIVSEAEEEAEQTRRSPRRCASGWQSCARRQPPRAVWRSRSRRA